MAKQSRSIARLQLAALGVALAASLPTGVFAENWIVVLEFENGSSTVCVDRDSIRWEGSAAYYATKLCTSARPELVGVIVGYRVDCAQDLSQALIDVAYRLEDGIWRDQRVDANLVAGVVALAVCRGL